jgi:hypothetical protein
VSVITARRVAAAVLAVVALGLTLLLVSSQYGLAREYGAGGGLVVLAVVPLVAALLAAVTWPGSGRAVTTGLAAFVVLTLAGTMAAAALGQRARDRDVAAADRAFHCNGESTGLRVDDRVDAAWAAFHHPAPLYGPIEGSRHGCTAGIDGGPAAFAAWRQALIASGWTVVEDDQRVHVRRAGVHAVLTLDGDVPMLRISTGEPASCHRAGPADGEVAAGC